MSFRSAEGVSIMQALAMTVAEIPVFLYSTFGQSIFSQLKLSPSLKKVLFATALGSVALALTAHQLKRRGRKRKQTLGKEAQKPVGIPEQLLRSSRPASLKRGPVPARQMMSPSTRSNDTLSGVSSIAQSKHSSSSHSIASMRVPSSPNQSVNAGAAWEAEPVAEEPAVGEDANAENLYLMGMELFEEALRKWELALNIRHRSHSRASASNSQGSELVERHSPEVRNHQFAEKLETLLHRAYHLQEDFGSTIPPDSLLADLESEGTLILPTLGSSHPIQDDDATTVTSDDSFFSAAELFETFSLEDSFHLLKPAALYEEALSLVKDGDVACRSLRTELLECYSDQDFLAKLHCVRQAFQVLLLDETHRVFFMETGKQMISGLLVKANKSPKAFLESYEDMLQYTQREETWPVSKMELEGRGVVCMNFFDIVLDFILMDAFEDLESPPSSVVAVLRNRWLSDSFKETALATACWSVLKAKRRLLMVPDGFIAHFYVISEHVSPVLAFGFLGPQQHLSEVCTIFKQRRFTKRLRAIVTLQTQQIPSDTVKMWV
ncbi:mitoguardin 2 isoform X2 [Danio aesculapii]|uniref:mitoguardin 2 isoform X2 n=1 Tax=Danio aesculapii TaxID=1142201 RepID=UPI0024C00558|nr:mitoguardin 2 isoform X2 [Danio aesculapii]